MSSGKHIFDSSSDLDWSVQNKLKLNTCGLLQFIARSEVLCSLWDSYNRKDEAQLHSESRQKEQNRNYKNVRYLEQWPFLAKIQNRTNKKSRMEILLLSNFLVMWSETWIVVVFPIQVFGHVIKNLDGSGFSHPNFLDSSSFYHPTFLTVVFWQVFFVI